MTLNHFVVVQYPTGKLEILELIGKADPVEVARTRGAYLVGITASRSRAEFIMLREQTKTANRH